MTLKPRGFAQTPAAAQALLAVGALLTLACAASRLWLIPARFSANPNEGWNAFQAAHALGAGPLYPAAGALTGNNYPPLSFLLVGWAGRMVGDPIVAGRVIALLALVATAAFIFLCVRRFSAGASQAPALATLLFLAFNATQFRGYLAMNDPQWLGHALMTAGLLAVLPGRPNTSPGAARTVAAALLMVAGGMVKHNLVAFPLATTLWLALHHRRALTVWLLTAAAALAACAALCLHAYGPVFFTDLAAGDRRYSWLRMVVKSALPVLAALPLTIVSARLLSARRADTRLDLLLLAAVIGVVIGVLQRSGEGVNVNAHFEALIALCLCGGVALTLTRDAGRLRAYLALLLLPFLVLVPTTANAEYREATGRAAAQAAWTGMERRIAATPGRVACETLALCYWAGKDFELDFFLYGQHVTRRRESSVLDRALAEHRFAGVELDAPHPAKRGDIANPLIAILAGHSAVLYTGADGRRLLAPAP